MFEVWPLEYRFERAFVSSGHGSRCPALSGYAIRPFGRMLARFRVLIAGVSRRRENLADLTNRLKQVLGVAPAQHYRCALYCQRPE